jgi:hypothetical protein
MPGCLQKTARWKGNYLPKTGAQNAHGPSETQSVRQKNALWSKRVCSIGLEKVVIAGGWPATGTAGCQFGSLTRLLFPAKWREPRVTDFGIWGFSLH